MLPDALQALLILQERDMRRVQLEKILAQIPRERATCEAKIASHRAGIDAAKKAVTDLELRRKEIESTLRSLEDQIARYRTQQMQVKKNDEYQALTHEIEQTQSKIGAAEEAEIKLLYELDTERAKTKAAEKALLEEIANENAQLSRLVERDKNVRTDLAKATAEFEAARAPVSPAWLPRYDRLAKTVGLPVVVALQGQKCGGCHLKVSNGVETQARIGSGDIAACDNCGRILFFQP
jgi:uncharacterized protein